MKTYQLTIFLIFSSAIIYAQTAEQVLQKVCNRYTVNQYMYYSTLYKLYKDERAKTVYQLYNGAYYKSDKNELYLKIGETEFYSNEHFIAQVSHDEKIVLLADVSQDLTAQYDIKKLLPYFSKYKMTDKKDHWDIEMISAAFSTLPYGKLVLSISKDYTISKQVFYYSTGVNFSNDYSKPDMHNPVLEITFSKPDSKPIPASRFNTAALFTGKGKNIKLTAKYTNYELIDQR